MPSRERPADAPEVQSAVNPAGSTAAEGTLPAASAPISLATTTTTGWLHTHAKDLKLANDPVAPGIYRADNTRWQGRGVVIHDSRNCDSCDWRFSQPNVTETLRRIDLAVDGWHANFLRLVIESYKTADAGVSNGAARASWQSLLYDAAYLESLKTIVDYIGTKKGVYVELSMWRDASLNAQLQPTVDSTSRPGSLCDLPTFANTPTTTCTWKKLATVFRDSPHVLYNVDAEPARNFDGAGDVSLAALLRAQVEVIRNVEDAAGTPHHIIAVPGTRSWARSLTYWAHTGADNKPVLNAIDVAGGDNIAYQTHPYSSSGQFQALFLDTAKYLPVIVGEFGPYEGMMTLNDVDTAITAANRLRLPFAAWSMHPNCGPLSLLTEPGSSDGTISQCDGSQASKIGTTAWGDWYKAKLLANLLDDPSLTASPNAVPGTSPSTPPAGVPSTPTNPVSVNLAAGRAATQSSTYQTAKAARATDGNLDGTFAAGSVSHTADRPGTTDPFWQIDLGAVRTLNKLVVYPRTDCCQERLLGAIAFISNDPFKAKAVGPLLDDASVTMVRLSKYQTGAEAVVSLGNVQGRYVRIALPGPNQILALAEVQVWGQ